MQYKVLTFLLLTLLVGCSSEDEIIREQEIWLFGYECPSKYSTTYEPAGVEFLFFPANNGEKYKTVAKTFNGTISEYKELKDDIFDLLTNGKMMLENGTIVNATKICYVPTSSYTFNIWKLPIGKYFIAAIYTDWKDGNYWLCSTKYTGIYYELKSSYNPPALTVVFPRDSSRYGYIKWTSWHEKFDYEFTY